MKHLLSFFTWSIFAVYINLIPPVGLLSYLTFFVILFLSIYATTLIIFKKLKFNLLLALYLISFPILIFFKQFNILNSVLVSFFFSALYLLIK